MAEQFAAAYRSLPWEAIYVSPMRRTLATAAPLCAAIGKEPRVRDGLKEIAYEIFGEAKDMYADMKGEETFQS